MAVEATDSIRIESICFTGIGLYRRSGRPESRRCPRSRALRFDLTIARPGARLERIDQGPRDGGDFLDRLIERSLVRLRRLVESRKLPDELQRSGADLVVRGER